MEENILEGIGFAIPALVTGAVAYFVMTGLRNQDTNEKKIELLAQKKKESLPVRLQAYERMTLFLERINPSNLLIRITSVNNDKNAYAVSIMNSIEQEFEHNLAQQIYITDECWNVIVASKNATLQLITKTSQLETVTNAQDLREAILTKMIEVSPPSKTALVYIKNEVKNMI